MPEKPFATVRIKIKNNNGTFYISSDDVQGLWLWGKDPETLFSSVIPTIEELYKYNEHITVKVKEASRSVIERWFAKEKIPDRFEIYRVNKMSEQSLHGG
jgi:hypothetical protein